MDDVIEQKRDVMPSAWVPKGGEKRAAKGAGRVRGSQEAPANGAKGGKKTLDEAAMTPFLREITLVSSGGAFLDGYVLSLIGVALTQITAQMSLTTHWTAAIGASVLLGILVGSIVGGYLTDIIGRKKMFVLDIIAIALFSALSMTDATPMQLVIYRFSPRRSSPNSRRSTIARSPWAWSRRRGTWAPPWRRLWAIACATSTTGGS